MAEVFGGSAAERVPEDVPDGVDFEFMQGRLRELREISTASVLDRLSALREDQRLEHDLYGHLKAAGWPDEIAIRIRLELVDGFYEPVMPGYLQQAVMELEYESEHPGAVHKWCNSHVRDLERLSEDSVMAASMLAEALL